MNKLQFIYILFIVTVLSACSKNSHIPNKSILEEIPTMDLADILEYEKSHNITYDGQTFDFEELYPGIREEVSELSEIEKAKFAKLTYRELINAVIDYNDTILEKKLEGQWQARYDSLLPQAKAIAKELEEEIISGYRIEFWNNYASTKKALSLYDYIEMEGLKKYFFIVPYNVTYFKENSWDYDYIIRDKIDPTFEREFSWVHQKLLESIKDKHPLAYELMKK